MTENRTQRSGLRRYLGRLRRALLGYEPLHPGVLRDPESAAELERLRRAETERSRLESHGWTFELPKRLRILNDVGIDFLIDCGANRGQYVEKLRKAGWSGTVHSFEPLSEARAALEAKAAGFTDWHVHPFALGEKDENASIQVAGNSYSSSILEFSEGFVAIRPDVAPVGVEVIPVRRLDAYLSDAGIVPRGKILLKLDVQGYEQHVLRGAEGILDQVDLIQCELAHEASYVGAPLFGEVRDYLKERGFVLVHLVDGNCHPGTGELRESDGLFANVNRVKIGTGIRGGNSKRPGNPS
jgi:FkbM family methyltransferase